mmetsp:Transcript_11127/g.26719  ORF Transcript_11127/g.26719 Transcript_11127/m.26719 type:complete len:130 (-) Transcript_11127:785-1174(-)
MASWWKRRPTAVGLWSRIGMAQSVLWCINLIATRIWRGILAASKADKTTNDGRANMGNLQQRNDEEMVSIFCRMNQSFAMLNEISWTGDGSEAVSWVSNQHPVALRRHSKLGDASHQNSTAFWKKLHDY